MAEETCAHGLRNPSAHPARALAPNRRGDLARLGSWALLAGFTATLINASLAGLLM